MDEKPVNVSSHLSNLKYPAGSRKDVKRVGRGMGSGRGRTSGRGHKGHKARAGGGVSPGFEGGQMPLIRRVPKRGFFNPFRKHWAEVNIRDLARFPQGSEVGPDELRKAGLIKGRWDGIKILGTGDLKHPLTVRADAFSSGAIQKINAAGGKAIELRATGEVPAEKTVKSTPPPKSSSPKLDPEAKAKTKAEAKAKAKAEAKAKAKEKAETEAETEVKPKAEAKTKAKAKAEAKEKNQIQNPKNNQ